jgi:hypothetical protein
MATYFRTEDKAWTQIGDDVDLEAYAREYLEQQQGQDSDNGYFESIEF